jgi:hypothetical protein
MVSFQNTSFDEVAGTLRCPMSANHLFPSHMWVDMEKKSQGSMLGYPR